MPSTAETSESNFLTSTKQQPLSGSPRSTSETLLPKTQDLDDTFLGRFLRSEPVVSKEHIPPNQTFLGRFRFTPLIPFTTPIAFLPILSSRICESGEKQVRIFAKRDDLTGLAWGGNKLRNLEFLLGDALDQGCDTVLTSGSLDSDYFCQFSGAAAKLGLQVHLLVDSDKGCLSDSTQESLYGARVHVHPASKAYGLRDNLNEEEEVQALRSELQRLQFSGQLIGRTPLVIPAGPTARGALGYVKCAVELFSQQYRQFCPPDPAQELAVVCAASSGETLAGLAVGVGLLRAQGLLDRQPVRVVRRPSQCRPLALACRRLPRARSAIFAAQRTLWPAGCCCGFQGESLLLTAVP